MSQPVPRPQGTPYTLPTAVRLSPDINYGQTTSLSQSNSHQSYIANQGSDAAPVIGGVVTFLQPPVIPGGSSGAYASTANPISLAGNSATVNVLTGFAGKLPVSSSAIYALQVLCSNDTFSFTTVGQITVNSAGTISASGFNGNSYQITQGAGAVTAAQGADVSMPNSGVGGSNVTLGQYTTGGSTLTYTLNLFSLAPAPTPV
jgi:hypothetical protein